MGQDGQTGEPGRMVSQDSGLEWSAETAGQYDQPER